MFRYLRIAKEALTFCWYFSFSMRSSLWCTHLFYLIWWQWWYIVYLLVRVCVCVRIQKVISDTFWPCCRVVSCPISNQCFVQLICWMGAVHSRCKWIQNPLWFSSWIALNQMLSNNILHSIFIWNALFDRNHSFCFHSLYLVGVFYWACVCVSDGVCWFYCAWSDGSGCLACTFTINCNDQYFLL